LPPVRLFYFHSDPISHFLFSPSLVTIFHLSRLLA
jgi:hypothetical protein